MSSHRQIPGAPSGGTENDAPRSAVMSDRPPARRILLAILGVAVVVTAIVVGLIQIFHFQSSELVYQRELSLENEELRTLRERDQRWLAGQGQHPTDATRTPRPVEQSLQRLLTEPLAISPLAAPLPVGARP